jgi:hypothetical protein
MQKIVIIGTSAIVEEHLKVLKDRKFKIFAICTTNSKSKNIKRLSLKYNIPNHFTNLNNLFKFLKNKKNYCFFLAPRIKDTENILLQCLRFDKKIFVEKPLSLNLNFYQKIKKYQKLIFVGYNRIYYQNINYLKKKIKKAKNLFISISCSEVNKRNILTNSCHLISIITFIFDKIRVTKVYRNKNYIFAELKDNKNNFFIFRVSFRSSENYEIKIIDHQHIYKLKPIELMREYNNMHQINIDNINYYKPKLFKTINEYKINKYKPGFLNQIDQFKAFLYKGKKHNSTIGKSKEIMSICKKIYGK